MNESANVETLDTLHHVAISVDDIAEAVAWYTEKFRCRVVYQDDTWAMLQLANTCLAFVSRSQHPPHLGFASTEEKAHQFGRLKVHRDGTSSVYIQDPSGNAVELLVEKQEGE